MSEIPEKVQIGPFRYTVDVSSRAVKSIDRECVGATNHTDLTILVDPELPHDMIAETCLHEVVHAIVDKAGLRNPDSKKNEHFVRVFSPWLLDTMRRNRELVAYLMEE